MRPGLMLRRTPDRALKNRTVRPKAGRMAALVVTLKKNITVVPQLIGVLMAAAMNFHMYFTVFNSGAHNYCPVLFIITQKCGVQVDPIRSASRIRSESPRICCVGYLRSYVITLR